MVVVVCSLSLSAAGKRFLLRTLHAIQPSEARMLSVRPANRVPARVGAATGRKGLRGDGRAEVTNPTQQRGARGGRHRGRRRGLRLGLEAACHRSGSRLISCVEQETVPDT